MKEEYITRIIEPLFERKLNSAGCVLVGGPKFCGKTTLCQKYASSKTLLKTNAAIELVRADPKIALDGTSPLLIDEWQKVPEIWNLIKDDLDKEYEFGKYIITGSTTPVDSSKIQHSGAGRFSFVSLRPFTLFESKESNGNVSLLSLFQDPNQRIVTIYPEANEISLKDIAYLMCRGGWPISCLAKKEYALDVTRNYFDGLFTLEDESDEFADFLKNKDIGLLKVILKEYARNISTQARRISMIKDILASGDRQTLDENTFNLYLEVLKKLYIVFDLPAWNLNLRSTVSVRTTPTHHFYDTSIALASLGIQPMDLLNDLHSFGLFFEDFAVRDLSVYAESIRGRLKHYLDSNGQEVDTIIEMENGTYCAIEIKIGSEKNINDGIKSLVRFEEKMKSNQLKTPQFKMVLTSHGACYRSKEGVYVVPINCLKN